MRTIGVHCTISLCVLWATAADAACPPNQAVFSACRIAGRNAEVSVCHDDQHATYRYGPVGEAPELTLSETMERLEFEPWSGVTREIGESVTFHNGPYSYTVVAGFERLPPSDDPRDESGERDAGTRHYGWVNVERNGQNLLHLECIPDSVDYAFGGGLYDLKVRTRQSWDDRLRRWMPEPG